MVDMMKLIMEQTAQLKQMEAEMDKLIKETEKAAKKLAPLEALPITVILTAILATTSTRDVADQLFHAIQNMFLQTKEIKKLHDQVKLLEDHQKKSDIFHVAELQRAQNQIEAWKISTMSLLLATLLEMSRKLSGTTS